MNETGTRTPATPKTPGAEWQGRRVGFARPTLIIPTPQINITTPYATTGSLPTAGSLSGPTPGMYGRKASSFMFNQINGIKSFTMNTAKSGLGIGEKCSFCVYNKVKSWSKKWFTHFFLTFVLMIYTVGGALVFVAIEGRNEEIMTEKVIRPHRYQLIRDLRNLSIDLPHKASEGEWEGAALQLILKYEKIALDVNRTNEYLNNNPEGKTWTMLNAVVFCGTIFTTIGYGHIYPTTTTGKALTIVYSIIGIPLFLIVLTDFGKLFTRGIKFLWSFVRRLYYTGHCRKVRKTAHVQEIFKGAQMMYEIATFRRPSFVTDEESQAHPSSLQRQESQTQQPSTESETPTSPNISNFEIDDEFNLPISLALFILITYILIGAVLYSVWEGWKFFSAFYFVFISMSTTGFGDMVPKDPICMIVSIVYLVFGLALMSMCINVVQEKLSVTFRKASMKIGMSMGLEVSEMEGEEEHKEDGELARVHWRQPGEDKTGKSGKEEEKSPSPAADDQGKSGKKSSSPGTDHQGKGGKKSSSPGADDQGKSGKNKSPSPGKK